MVSVNQKQANVAILQWQISCNVWIGVLFKMFCNNDDCKDILIANVRFCCQQHKKMANYQNPEVQIKKGKVVSKCYYFTMQPDKFCNNHSYHDHSQKKKETNLTMTKEQKEIMNTSCASILQPLRTAYAWSPYKIMFYDLHDNNVKKF